MTYTLMDLEDSIGTGKVWQSSDVNIAAQCVARIRDPACVNKTTTLAVMQMHTTKAVYFHNTNNSDVRHFRGVVTGTHTASCIASTGENQLSLIHPSSLPSCAQLVSSTPVPFRAKAYETAPLVFQVNLPASVSNQENPHRPAHRPT